MKKLFALLLTLVILCTLTAPALADELRCDPPLPPPSEPPVEPTPPEWVKAEDYVVFPGDEVYQPENWAKVLELRAKAENGAVTSDVSGGAWTFGYGTVGYRYEVGLVWLKCAENAGLTATKAGRHAFYAAGRAFSAACSAWLDIVEEKDTLYYQLSLCASRAYLLYQYGYGCRPHTLDAIFSHLDMTLDDFYNAPHMELVTPETRFLVSEDINEYLSKNGRPVPVSPEGHVQIFLDGSYLRLDVPPEVVNARTMIPIRTVAEALGADVNSSEAAEEVILTRAGAAVVMTPGSTTALVNGKAVTMDAAPYVSNGHIFVPVSCVSKFFGQKVEWESSTHRVFITENKSAVGNSNIEDWAIPMGMILGYYNTGDHTRFGFGRSASNAQAFRKYLGDDSWGIRSREELIYTVCSMTVSGHNGSFLLNAAYINSLSPAQYNQYRNAYQINTYMVPYTKQLSQKWGDRGILCWDLFRMATLVQWGYTAGYLTYAEALALLEPATTLLCENFSSWDEAYENYLDGYNWWARNNVLNQNIWETKRGELYLELKSGSATSALFDDTLFKAGVISVPGVTAEELLKSVLG